MIENIKHSFRSTVFILMGEFRLFDLINSFAILIMVLILVYLNDIVYMNDRFVWELESFH